MRQNIQLQPEYHSAFLDSALSEYFRHAGDRFAEESAIFSTAVRCVLASEGHLTNKAIILWLSSSRTVNLEPLILKGKELKYRVVVIRSGFGDLFSDTSALLWFNRPACHGNHSHGCALAASLH